MGRLRLECLLVKSGTPGNGALSGSECGGNLGNKRSSAERGVEDMVAGKR